MICGFCGREIPDKPDLERTSCGSCIGGCKKVHCPHCGYANPVVPKFLQRLGRKKDQREES